MEQAQHKALDALLDRGGYILFLGAGVGVEAGLPSWGSALGELAEILESYAHLYAAVMREEIGRNRYLHAAEHFYLAPITLQDRADILNKVFGKPTSFTPRLQKLIRTPFHGIVTTNYDTSLIETAVKESIHLRQFTESDKDLSSARLESRKYILRIHGRIEVPDSIVLSLGHYRELAQREEYEFFLQNIVTDEEVIFFGFSFNDPYFRVILEHLQTKTTGRMKRQSFAFFSTHPDVSMQQLLAALNIVPVIYDPKNGHEEAWELVTGKSGKTYVPARHYREARLRRYFASVLTHLQLQKQSDLHSAVLSAAVETTIRLNGGGTIPDVVEKVRSELALPMRARDVVRNAIFNLKEARKIRIMDDQLVLEEVNSSSGVASDKRLDLVINGVLARAETRYGFEINTCFDYVPHLKEIFLRILVADGMALAHSLIQRERWELERVDALIESAVSLLETPARQEIEPLREAISSILTRPQTDEEAALDELASISFIMCLTLTDPGIPAIAEQIARHNVYLDASIVLPWISEGHPSQAFYGAIVESFGTPVLADFYVNEIVSHRELAVKEFSGAGLQEKPRLERYSLFFRLNNANTFIGGYGGLVALGYEKSFDEYLAEVAPFNSEMEAEKYLESRGIRVEKISVHNVNLPYMEKLLADKLEVFRRQRNPIRIQHDAKMVGYLAERGKLARPYFVTADRSVVAAFSKSLYGEVVENILFPHQAFGIAQLSGKSKGLVKGIARTVFGMRGNTIQQIKEFFIDRVLKEYEPILLRDLPDIIDSIVTQAKHQFGSNPFAIDDDALEVARIKDFTALDQLEANFHLNMLKAKQKRNL